MQKQQLIEQARVVLSLNDAGTHTRPAPGLYPHQWLWDSCFIAIGLAHIDTHRAAQEIYSLLEGQWSNGMVPHMIFAANGGSGRSHNLDGRFWQSNRNPHAPQHMQTSGITQPPMIAEACWRIAKEMNQIEAAVFLKHVYPHLISYHRWIYRERDPDQNGIAALFHPWETGLDNSPGWMEELARVHTPLWVGLIETLQLEWIIERVFRRDIKRVKSDERMSTSNALRLTHVALELKKRSYKTEDIMRNPHFVIESLSFNSILIGNNNALENIAHVVGVPIPDDLARAFELAKNGLDSLWDESNQTYCHRNYLTGRTTPIHGVSKLLPLYSGAISREHAQILVDQLNDPKMYGTTYPIPSVPKDSEFYSPNKYWQGPTWMNTNWLIIQGLRKYGFTKEAERVKQSSIALFSKSGSFEYYNPETGHGRGAENFAWTAALILDLLKE